MHVDGGLSDREMNRLVIIKNKLTQSQRKQKKSRKNRNSHDCMFNLLIFKNYFTLSTTACQDTVKLSAVFLGENKQYLDIVK